MEFWEFLLQKEGDHSWIRPKTTNFEIRAGRYRVAAKSSRANAEVEVAVTYQAAGKQPSQRKTKRRSHSTNPEGLMVVIPFTNLTPGIWELCCSSNQKSPVGKWQQTLKLEVIPSLRETSPVTQTKAATHIEDAIAPDSNDTNIAAQSSTEIAVTFPDLVIANQTLANTGKLIAASAETIEPILTSQAQPDQLEVADNSRANTVEHFEEELNHSLTQESILPPKPKALNQKPTILCDNLLKLVKHPQNPKTLQLQPAPHQPLPPQIYQPTSKAKALQSPQLPKLPHREKALPQSPKNDHDIEATYLIVESSNQPKIVDPQPWELDFNPQTDTTTVVNSQFSAEAIIENSIQSEVVIPAPELTEDQFAQEASLMNNSFQELNLEDRFWSRLNALAIDGNVSEGIDHELLSIYSQANYWEVAEAAELDREIQAALDFFDNPFRLETPTTQEALWQPAEKTQTPNLPVQLPTTNTANASFDWASLEIVVEDELPVAEETSSAATSELDTHIQESQYL